MEIIVTCIITTLRTTCPRYFFGTPVAAIYTEADALNAIRKFCELAPQEVISATANELKVLSQVNRDFYNLINNLLWKVELPLGSYGWHNHFCLLNKHLD